MSINFKIEKKIKGKLGRAGILSTPHGDIETPAFVTVGTKATVKALSPEQVKSLGAQVVLANTYHLYLQPGDELIKEAGGFAKFMNWDGPTMTDSGGFQVFSLGAAYGTNISKHARQDFPEENLGGQASENNQPLAKIDEEGVTFKSPIDGSKHRFTPERSMEIQHNLGADMFFAFDECTSPTAPVEYQKEALERTHRWAKRCLDFHKQSGQDKTQALFGVVQGGRHEDLRRESARVLGAMDFPGYGIGGSFNKDDTGTAVAWVNSVLPEEKPRHLLGIGEPRDLFDGVENGCDLFDCVAPTRIARNGTLYTNDGTVSMTNARFRNDLDPLDENCECYTCKNYTKAYLAHLYRSKEMFAATLGSIHNLHFIISLVARMRKTILDGNFDEFKTKFISRYYK